MKCRHAALAVWKAKNCWASAAYTILLSCSRCLAATLGTLLVSLAQLRIHQFPQMPRCNGSTQTTPAHNINRSKPKDHGSLQSFSAWLIPFQHSGAWLCMKFCGGNVSPRLTNQQTFCVAKLKPSRRDTLCQAIAHASCLAPGLFSPASREGSALSASSGGAEEMGHHAAGCPATGRQAGRCAPLRGASPLPTILITVLVLAHVSRSVAQWEVIREDSDVLPEGLPDVLVKSDATEIEPDTFSELDRYDIVNSVQLFLPNLVRLPEMAFGGRRLHILGMFYLNAPRLEHIEEGAFEGLSGVSALVLRSTLAEYPTEALSVFNEVADLFMTGEFSELPIGALEHHPKLRSLDLQETKIAWLYAGALSGLPRFDSDRRLHLPDAASRCEDIPRSSSSVHWNCERLTLKKDDDDGIRWCFCRRFHPHAGYVWKSHLGESALATSSPPGDDTDSFDRCYPPSSTLSMCTTDGERTSEYGSISPPC